MAWGSYRPSNDMRRPGNRKAILMTTNRICIIGFAGCTIEPLDCGEMDNFALLGCLIGELYREFHHESAA